MCAHVLRQQCKQPKKHTNLQTRYMVESTSNAVRPSGYFDKSSRLDAPVNGSHALERTTRHGHSRRRHQDSSPVCGQAHQKGVRLLQQEERREEGRGAHRRQRPKNRSLAAPHPVWLGDKRWLAGCLFGNGVASVSVGFEGPEIHGGAWQSAECAHAAQSRPLQRSERSPNYSQRPHTSAITLDLANTDDDFEPPPHTNRTLVGR